MVGARVKREIAIALSGLLFLASPLRAEERGPPAPLAVAVTRASNECFASVVRATGYIVPHTTAVVMFNAPGFRIAEVSAKEGDWIKAGDQVAVAASDDPGPDHRPSGAPSRIPIKSLATGQILTRQIAVGVPLSATMGPLFTIAVDGDMEALVDVPSIHVLELNTGQIAHVTMDDGRELTGHVRVVPVEINTGTQIGQARIAIDNEINLRMGRFVRVTIDARRSCGIGVPIAALVRASDGTRLQIVRDGIIETRIVGVGLLGDTDAEVTQGLVEGDLVVSDAGTSLRDGDRVRPTTPDSQDLR